MSVKVSFNNINSETINMISDFNVALVNLEALRKTYKSDREKLEIRLNALQEERAKLLEQGEDDKALSISTLEIQKDMNALDIKYEEDCKPYKDMKKAALNTLDNNLYYAYLLAMSKGLGATGTLPIKTDKKTGKVTESVKIEKSFTGTIANWLVGIGATCPNDNAINKFAQIMTAHVAGLKKTSKLDNGYATTKKAAEFKELFLRAFMQIAIVEKKVLTVAEDGTVSATVF